MSTIFGGDTGISYEDVQKKRKIAEALTAANLRTPQSLPEGIGAIGRALAARSLDKKAGAGMEQLDSQWAEQVSGMGVDPQRLALWKNLPYEQRNSAALDYLNTMDAERRAAARSGASASRAAAKEAAEAAEAEQRRMAIVAALGGGATAAPSGDFVVGSGLSFGSKSPAVGSNPMPEGNVTASMLRNGDPGLVAPMMLPSQTMPRPAPVAPPPAPTVAPPPASPAPEFPAPQGLSFGQAVQPQQQQPSQFDIKGAIQRALMSGDRETAKALSEYVDIFAEEDTAEGSASGGTDYSLTPQYVTNPDGTLGMIQLGKDGSVNVVEMPEGLALQKGVEKLDLGTSWQWYNTVTGTPIGEPIQKDLAGEASETARGTAEGKRKAEKAADAPKIIQQSTQTIELIDSILTDPNLPAITGKFQGRLDPEGMSGLLMGQGAVDLAIKVENLKGKAFMEAFDTLKGAGQITEREGAAATAAIARLQRVQSEGEYRKALNELRTIADNARRRAAGEEVPEYNFDAPSAPPPASGSGRIRYDAQGNRLP